MQSEPRGAANMWLIWSMGQEASLGPRSQRTGNAVLAEESVPHPDVTSDHLFYSKYFGMGRVLTNLLDLERSI